MRLIDADKLETDTIYATHLNHVECGYHYSYSEGIINEAPTVNAIPIEWIKNYIENQYKEGHNYTKFIIEEMAGYGNNFYYDKARHIKEMLMEWEKENE